MWLINASTVTLQHFSQSKIPKYTILSHTWEDEEVSFQEMAWPSSRAKKGYRKIKETCARTLEDRFCYAWYGNAERCYVYLSDLKSGVSAQDGFGSCRWFTRGWTLQELTAPRDIQFYDQRWKPIGSKDDFVDVLTSVTKISTHILLGLTHPKRHSVATRMSWVSHRKTERTEDLAYCLFGIFDVHMPLIYGEGSKAFLRLQEEIIKQNNDLTIFAWDHEQSQVGLFALSPTAFSGSSGLEQPFETRPVFTMTNKGLKFEEHNSGFSQISVQSDEVGPAFPAYILDIARRLNENAEGNFDHFSVQLLQVAPGVFVRDGKLLKNARRLITDKNSTSVQTHKFYIHQDSPQTCLSNSSSQTALHIPKNGEFRIHEVIPDSYWDEKHRLLFGPTYVKSRILIASFKATSWAEVSVVVVIDLRSFQPSCWLFDAEKDSEMLSSLFRPARNLSNEWYELQADYAHLFSRQQVATVDVSKKFVKSTISISLERGVYDRQYNVQIYSLILTTKIAKGNIFQTKIVRTKIVETKIAEMKNENKNLEKKKGLRRLLFSN